MKRKAQPGKASAFSPSVVLAYAGTLVLFLLAAMFHPNDLWSVDWWAFYPPPIPIGLFVLGLLFLYAVGRLKGLGGDNDISDSRYLAWAVVITITSGLLFWLLRAQTHYLGDGYQLLSRLASDNPIIKPWNYGGIVVPFWLSRLLGDGSEASVLLSYQVISITAGLILALVTFWAVRRLFEANIDRLLFLLGVMTAGTSLLFFGYVENYSLFVVSVFSFGLVGLLVAQGKASRFWIVPVFALSVFFHIFGLILLPAMIYLLAAGSDPGDSVASESRTVKLAVSVVVLIAGVAAFWYLYGHYYFFRFSFVPFVTDRFTVDGYTLFSGEHLLDWLSLLLLFVPGLFVVIAVLSKGSLRVLFQRRDFWFLAIMLVCCLGAVFLLDPKLGMPRDWDLFSFAGAPLVLIASYTLLNSGGGRSRSRKSVLLVIGLGALILIPRAATQVDDDVTAAHLKNYFAHDVSKNIAIRTIWIEHLRVQGATAQANVEAAKGRNESPELAMADEAWSQFRDGNVRQAMVLFRKVVALNPMRSKAWAGIGCCYVQFRQPDSALPYLHISEGLSPYRPFNYNALGFAYYNMGQYEASQEYWQKAWEMDTSLVEPLVQLCKQYAKFNDVDSYDSTFYLLASRKYAPVDVVTAQIRRYLEQGQTDKGRHVFSLLVKNFLEAPEVKSLEQDFPELRDLSPTN